MWKYLGKTGKSRGNKAHHNKYVESKGLTVCLLQCSYNGSLPFAVTSGTAPSSEVLIDLMTYVSVTRHCGLIFKAEQVPNAGWIVEV